MAEVLSQNEIDALLHALSSGEVDFQEIKEVESSKKVKKYDFKNPQKIAKDQLRTLEIIHENLGRLFQTFLSGYLRAPVKISILTVDQFAYSEFSNAISNPAFISIIDFKPLNGQILIDISTNVAYSMIDRLLGGDGSKDQDLRVFTEIELTLLEGMMDKAMSLIKEAWSNVIDLKPKLDKIEVNPQFAQIVPHNETIALITFNLEIGSKEGMLNICIPYLVIEPILDKLSTRFWFSTTQKELSEKELLTIKNRMLDTKVPVRVELGSTVVRIKDILTLQEGDVIRLDTGIDEKAKVRIGSNVKYYGNVGKTKKKMAVKIINVAKDGDD
ncbi:flagellar motor switch protein FliM [Clostridium sp. Cult2]|uniref:flagellar motor switch protein FliM n=1 Tax=Clostridium sp. Cult2 TaxID=2079003 RepID=UPI001EFFC37B|nr:flagellar motor switch protein FliM [Clostridium sp. Cult2]MCF6466303.1 flagellar motor switch protein FliM [Clostridium sp. Cult2]